MSETFSLSIADRDPSPSREAAPGRGHERLARFLLLAAVLHLAAFGLWRPDPPAPPAGASPVTVALAIIQEPGAGGPAPARPATQPASTWPGARATEPEANPAAPPPAAQRPPRDPVSHPTGRAAPLSAAASQRSQASQADIAPHREADTPPFLRPAPRASRQAPGPAAHPQATGWAGASLASPDAEQTRARLGHRLRASIAHHFRYPALARRRGWEGHVEVGLRVEPDGELSRVHLVSTSGHALLDRDAVTTVRRIAGLPNVAGWLGGQHFDMVLPVHYRLVGD